MLDLIKTYGVGTHSFKGIDQSLGPKSKLRVGISIVEDALDALIKT